MYYKPNWHLSTEKKVEIKTGLQTSQRLDLDLDFPLNIGILVNVYDLPTSDFYTHRRYGHQLIPDPYAFVLDFLIQLT